MGSGRYDDLLDGLDGGTRRPASRYDDLLDGLEPDDRPWYRKRWDEAKEFGRQAVRHPFDTFVDMPAHALANAVAVATAPEKEKVGGEWLPKWAGVEPILAPLRERTPTWKERGIAAAQVAATLTAPETMARFPITTSAVTGAVFDPEDPVRGATFGAAFGSIPTVGRATRRFGSAVLDRTIRPDLGAGFESIGRDLAAEAKPRDLVEGIARRPAGELKPARRWSVSDEANSRSFLGDVERAVAEEAPALRAEFSPYADLLEGLEPVQPRAEPLPGTAERLSETHGTVSFGGVRDVPTYSSGADLIPKSNVGRRAGEGTPAPRRSIFADDLERLDAEMAPYRQALDAVDANLVVTPRAEPFPPHPGRLSETHGTVSVGGRRDVSMGRDLEHIPGARRRPGRAPEPVHEVPVSEDLAAIEGPVDDSFDFGANVKPEPEPTPVAPIEYDPATLSFGGTEVAGADVREMRPKGREVPLFEEAREPSGKLRNPAKVSADALIRELRSYEDKIQEAQERAQYTYVQDESNHITQDIGKAIPMADRRGGGASRQAKAFQNLKDYERITAEMERELKRRGWSDDDIYRRRNELEAADEARAREAYEIGQEKAAAFDEERWGTGAAAAADDLTSFDFGANVEAERSAGAPVAEPVRVARETPLPVAESVSVAEPTPAPSGATGASGGMGGREPVVREPAESVDLNWKAFGGKDSPLARSVQSRVDELAEGLKAAKGRETFDEMRVRREAFAKKLAGDVSEIDPDKLRNLDGAQVAGMYQVVRDNTAAMEAASKAIVDGNLSAADLAAAHKIIDTASEQNHTLLTSIVREKADIARSLGFQRDLSHLSLQPDVWLVQAQRLAGNKRLSESIVLEVRRLAQEAMAACGLG